MAGQQIRQDAQVHERGGADLQTIRRAAAAAVDVEAEFALRIFVAEINFADRRVHARGDDHELVDQLLHARQHLALRRQRDLAVLNADGLLGLVVCAAGQD